MCIRDRLSNLALLSIENDRAQKINIDKVINDFASKKVRKQKFMYCLLYTSRCV